MSTKEFQEQRKKNLLERSRDFSSPGNFSAWRSYKNRYGGRDMTNDQIQRAY